MTNKSQEQQDLSSRITNRLNGLFFLVVVLFTILLLRLVDMQLIEQQFYLDKLNATRIHTIKSSNPRGQIFDAKGRPLVTNSIREVVAFTRTSQLTAYDMKQLATQLADLVTLTESQVTRREKVDYYLADPDTYRQVVDNLPRERRFDQLGNRLKEADVYQAAADSVPDEAIAYTDDELKLIYLFSQMNATPAFVTTSLKTGDLTAEQIARLSSFAKPETGLTIRADWERQVADTSLAPLLGTISTQKTGLPAEEAEDYLKKGYALNDRVGTSYLEKGYEEYLQGEKTIRTIEVDKRGKIISDQTTQTGQEGSNLQLTLDLEFQTGVEDILERYFQSELALGHAQHSEGVYAVALNPKTGAVLAMAGIEQDTERGELKKDALGTMTKVFTPGSVVKGATIASGWTNGVLSGNQTLVDQPIQLATSQPINSWFTAGSLPITAEQALEYSSNTYMVQLALKLMGQDYRPGMVLSTQGVDKAMTKLRETFALFGMGVATGIDLPGESIGYVPQKYDVANVLTESFGQFDNYTPLQLAQYVATIANGGQRLAPHLVSGFYRSLDPNQLGELEQNIEPQVLNTIPISSDDMAILQSGFYQVVNGGSGLTTGPAIGQGAVVPISAKTGTAEAYIKTADGKSVYTSNLNVVAYAPSQDPEIAVAVVFPHNLDLLGHVSHHITRDIINLYYSTKS